MPFTLKSTGPAASVAFVVMVDDDGAIKLWDTPGAGATRVIGSGLTQTNTVAVGAATTWKASAFSPQPMSSGGTAYLTIDTPIAWGVADETNGYTLFACGSRSSQPTVNQGLVGLNDGGANNGYWGFSEFSNFQRLLGPTGNTQRIGGVSIPTNGSKFSMALTGKDNSGASGLKFWTAAESDAGMTVEGTAYDPGNITGGTYQFSRIFARDNASNPAQGDFLVVVGLATELDETALDGLHADPFGVLFDSGGAAATLAVAKLLGRWRRMPTRMVRGSWRYVRTLADAAANLASNVFSVDVSEAGSATDSLSAQLSAAVSLAEAASAADTISNVLTSARSFTEAGGATDSLTTTATFPRSIGTEAGSAADSLSSSVGGFDVTIAETATAVDSISALLNAAVALTETGSATDSYSNLTTLLAALAESVAATDSYSSALNGGNYSVSLTEAAAAVESIAAQVAWARDVAETGNATDTTSAQAAFQRALAEAAAALDAVATGGITNVTITEAGSATDLVSAPTGFGEVPPERVITIQLADRVVRITKTRRPIRVLN